MSSLDAMLIFGCHRCRGAQVAWHFLPPRSLRCLRHFFDAYAERRADSFRAAVAAYARLIRHYICHYAAITSAIITHYDAYAIDYATLLVQHIDITFSILLRYFRWPVVYYHTHYATCLPPPAAVAAELMRATYFATPVFMPQAL